MLEVRWVMRWLVVLGVTLGAASCSFRTDVPASRTIACSGAAGAPACPEGYTCKPALGRCVSVADLARPPAGVVDAGVGPGAGNGQTTFTATFEVTGPLNRPPSVYATGLRVGQGTSAVETFPFACEACAPGASCTCTFTPDPNHLPPEGPLSVRVDIVDVVGNDPPPTSAGTVLLDYTPPDLEGSPSLEFSAPASVPVPVSALGPGGSLRVCFGVDEALAAPPVVWAAPTPEDSPGAGELAFDLEPGYPLGLRYCYRASPGAADGLADGPRHLLAALTDVASNRAVREVLAEDGGAALLVDATPPAAPDLSEPDGLRYLRAPEGDGSGPTPYFRLGSPGPALAEAGYLRVYEDAAGQLELAHAAVSQGRLDPPLALPGPDRPEVYVELFDRAGNRSVGGPQRVRSVDFVAALGRKVPGDTESSPHSCYARSVHGPGLFQADDVANEQGAASGPAQGDGGLASVAGQPTWHRRHTGVPESVGSAALAYDSARGQAVGLFHQEDVGTWTFDGRDFAERTGLTFQPAAREGASVAYDAARDRLVLFGGNYLCDTWEWDNQVWRKLADCHLADGGVEGPVPRSFASLAYDADRGRVLLEGGRSDTDLALSDQWEWDGASWRRLPSGAAPPPGRIGGSLAFSRDSAGQGLLLYVGGEGVPDGGTYIDSFETTQIWLGRFAADAGTYAWSNIGGQVCPPTNTVCARAYTAQDPSGRGFWVLDQLYPAQTIDTLTRWDGAPDSGWQPVATLNEVGLVSGFLGLPAQDEVLLYALNLDGSGGDPTVYLCRTDGGCEAAHQPLYQASARWGAGLAIDGQGNGVLVSGVEPDSSIFGGDNAYTDYSWSGDDWSPISSIHPGRIYPGVAYWPESGATWLFGGKDYQSDALKGDLWRFSGGSWAQQTAPAGVGAPEDRMLAWVPDAGSGQALLLASSSDSTWLLTLDGGAVVAQPRGGPAAHGALAYDERRGTAVITEIYGGITELAPGAQSWSEVATSGPEFSHAVYDRTLGQVVVVGEAQSGSLPGDTWSWDGHSLTHWDLADPEGDGQPALRIDPALAYDPVRDLTLLYGGLADTGSIQAYDDTWELRRAKLRPAEVCAFRFGAARAAEGAVLTGVSVQAQAQAEGAAGAAPATLQVFLDGAWREVDRCTPPACAPGAPGTLHYQASADQLGGLLPQRQTLGVALAPGVDNGAGTAKVGVRGLQAVFSYRLP